MGIEQCAHALLPARPFVLGKRLKEFGANAQFPLQRPRLAFAVDLPDRNELGYGLRPARDDHFLAFGSLLNQPRKVGLGLVYGDNAHAISLANLAYLTTA